MENAPNVSIFAATKYLWLLCLLYGIHSPLSIPKEVVPTKIPSKFKKCLSFSTYTLLIALLIIMPFHLKQTYDSEIELHSNQMTRIVDLLGGVVTCTNVLITFGYSFVYRKYTSTFLQDFNDIQIRLSKISGVFASYKSLQKFVNGMVVVWIVTCAILYSSITYTSLLCRDPVECLEILIYYFIIGQAADAYTIQSFAFLYVVKQQLKNIKQQLEQLNGPPPPPQCGEFQCYAVLVEEDKVKVIVCLKESHRILFNITKRINDYFSLPLLVTIAVIFTIVFTQSFVNLYSFTYDDEPLAPHAWLEYATGVSYISQCFLKLGCMTCLCDDISKECIRVRWLVHSIRVSKNEKLLQKHLLEFSLQLVHENIEFTGSGHFVINNALLPMLIHAMTVYIVIVVQFDQVV